MLRIWPTCKNIDKSFAGITDSTKIQSGFFFRVKKKLSIKTPSGLFFKIISVPTTFPTQPKKPLSSIIFHTIPSFFILCRRFNHFILENTKLFHNSRSSFVHMTFWYSQVACTLYVTRSTTSLYKVHCNCWFTGAWLQFERLKNPGSFWMSWQICWNLWRSIRSATRNRTLDRKGSTLEGRFDLGIAFRGSKYRCSFKAWFMYNQLRASLEILSELAADPVNINHINLVSHSVFCCIEAL